MKLEPVKRGLRYHLRYAAILVPLGAIVLIGYYYLAITHDGILWW